MRSVRGGGGGGLGILRGSLWVPVLGSPFLIRIAGLRLVILLIGTLQRGCFPVGFVRFLGAPFLQSASGRLLLLIPLSYPFLAVLYYS